MTNQIGVGFIGLGAMGAPMASLLAKAGVNLTVCDLDSAQCAKLAAMGARVVGSPAEVARYATRIMCMVETTAQVREVVSGTNGIMDTALEGHMIACMSTVALDELKELASELAVKKVMFIDAPVSGATEGATAGTLAIFASGDSRALDAFEPLFHIMGTNVFKLGPIGQGTVAKLVNNMLFHVNNVAVAEALMLGAKAGLDPQTIYEMVKVSTGYSVAFELRAPRMIAGNFEPGGKVDISYKDQELQTALAKRLGVPLLLATVSQQVYQMGKSMGFGREDGSAVIKVYDALTGGSYPFAVDKN